MWGIRAEVQVSRKEFHIHIYIYIYTYISLDYKFYLKKKKKKKDHGLMELKILFGNFIKAFCNKSR